MTPPAPLARMVGPIQIPEHRHAWVYVWCVVCAVTWGGGKATPRHVKRCQAMAQRHNEQMGHTA